MNKPDMLTHMAADMIFTIGYLSDFADNFGENMPEADRARVFAGFQNLCEFAALGLLVSAEKAQQGQRVAG